MKTKSQDMAEYMRERRQERLDQARERLGGCCVQCGSTESLEFDHVDPASKLKEVSSAAMLDGPLERLFAEVDKCQLLCKPCHIVKTNRDGDRGNAWEEHGTLSAYRYCKPPKCEPCKKVKREYMQQYKARGCTPSA
jgi:5-methylcytosine-specific restriction endonuclease McrA